MMRGAHQKRSRHAEEAAANKVRYLNLDNLTAYVARKDMKMAKPCSACQDRLREVGVVEVYYTTGDEIGYMEL